ncbi:MAG: hypothetical protein D3913_05980 [Candidatus Electrothrix sp. LOE1_4_5]|nr:hypothetical protein [Candidatus Electrothrix gigas]
MIQGLSQIDLHPDPMQIEYQFLIHSYLSFDHIKGHDLIYRKVALSLTFLALFKNYIWFWKKKLKDIALPPITLHNPLSLGRKLNTFQLQAEGRFCIAPFWIKDGQGVGKTFKGETKVNFTGPIDKGFILPPALAGQINIALIGPAVDFINVKGLASSGWSGYQ